MFIAFFLNLFPKIPPQINESPVVMYTKASCGYCKMAKDLLGKENIHYREHDLDAMKQERGLEEAQVAKRRKLFFESHFRYFLFWKFLGKNPNFWLKLISLSISALLERADLRVQVQTGAPSVHLRQIHWRCAKIEIIP